MRGHGLVKYSFVFGVTEPNTVGHRLLQIAKAKEALSEGYHRLIRSTQRAVAVMSDLLKKDDVGLNKQEGYRLLQPSLFAVFCALKYNVCLYI